VRCLPGPRFWSLFRTSAPLRGGDGQKDGQRWKLEEIARRHTRESQSVRWGAVLLAPVRARSDRKAGSGPGTTPGEYGFLGRRRSVGSIKRCQNDVSRPKPGDTEATRAVCDSFCDLVGFLIPAVRPPLIPWGGIANCGRRGIEPPVQFRTPHFSAVAAISRMCSAGSQKQSQIGTAVAECPSELASNLTDRWRCPL
jgi:hypothetical protein